MKTQVDKPVPGERIHIPAWVTDPEGVAPCFCGRPLPQGEPFVVAIGEYGMKRWFHAVCWQMLIDMYDEDDWEDWEDEDKADG